MSLNFVVLYGSVRAERQGIKFARFLDEFEWYSRALKEARKGGVPY